ncbi:unnamed protein product [Darwinula stevensoni]|uniref:Small ribosomal subunit protein uS2m n=1 Tax=Darwinula stevensoni TaxID=69355 RepID=A0A7R9FST4_9CRUS|nr:unnamed protein product [Darwinula stevensoni]CAG0903810.1 unnamed protein product [Darwinula stevensoni]
MLGSVRRCSHLAFARRAYATLVDPQEELRRQLCPMPVTLQTDAELLRDFKLKAPPSPPLPDFKPFVQSLVSVQDLFEARVHYGHRDGRLNPRMKGFLFGSRLGHTVFDLDQTLSLLHDALNFTAHVAYRQGVILFLSRHPPTLHLVERTAQECGEYSHCRRWRKGLFTNSEKQFGAVTRLPDLCIFLNTLDTVLEDHWAIGEAGRLAIPTVGIVDSDCNPSTITYPVPGNDDSIPAVRLYADLFKRTILEGKARRTKDEEGGKL